MALTPRVFAPPVGSYFLFGPRGTGKTTWLRSSFPDALVVDLLDPDRYRTLSARPEGFRDLVLGAVRRSSRPAGMTEVVVDEVQRAPELLPVVHGLIESELPVRFALTVSTSARKLRRGGENLLGGRAADCRLHPFMAAELGDAFNLDAALRRGLLPLVVADADPDSRLRSLPALYLDQEVRAEGLARDIGAFARFLEAMTFSQGAALNLSAAAREAAARVRTVTGYVEVLEDLLLAFRLPVFGKRARRRLAAHPKFFYFDCGVFRALRPAGPLDRPEEIGGAALEGLVAQHLRAFADYRGRGDRLFTWRTRSGLETDFVLYGPEDFWAVEVKNAARVRPEDLRGLRSFGDEYPEARRLLLYRGEHRLFTGGILCLPVADFLRRLHPARSLAAAADRAEGARRRG